MYIPHFIRNTINVLRSVERKWLITELMIENHLHADGWVHAVESIPEAEVDGVIWIIKGKCVYTVRTLVFDRKFLHTASDDAFIQTVLHEIAHAKAGHAAAHNTFWQTEAARLGVDVSHYATC